jgi:chemotaxis protein CheD
MENVITVGLGEAVISRNPEDVLVAFGLGSCLGIAFYDPLMKIGGLLHAVLPEYVINSHAPGERFVDTGIENLLKQMAAAGAIQASLQIRMVGGANMLVSSELSRTFDIGTRNLAAAYKTFERLRLKLACQEVGGNTGRTVRLYVADGRMTVRSIGGAERELG